MLELTRWRQSPVFDITNPGQMIQEHYTGLPGGYSSYYFDRIPTESHSLQGLGDGAPWSMIAWTGLVLGAVVGSYYALRRGKPRRRR
jgi:hypothetical protein